MLNMISIREEFNKKFNEQSNKQKTDILNEWFKIPFPEDNVLCSWFLESKKRGMRIQEAEEDEPIIFTGFTYHGRGINKDITELTLFVKESPKYINEIFELYKLWFFTDITQNEMDNLLNDYEKKLNS